MINRLRGFYAYTSSAGFGQGYGSAAGALKTVSAEMTVDFDNAQITNGRIAVNTLSDQEWLAHFSGNFDGAAVNLAAEANSFTIDNVANSGITSFGGAFTGAEGTSFVGGFEMLDANDSANFVQGVYNLDRVTAN